MKTKVINFVGAPSCGKSLMSALLFAELKTRYYSVELVQEYAKQLIWQERIDELNNQYSVSFEQYKMLRGIKSKINYLVTDSPLLLGLFYNRYHKDNVCDVKKTEKMILEKMNEFENIYIFLERNEEYQFEKIGRIHGEEESRIIAIELESLLKEFGLKYLKIKSDKKNIDKILDYILKIEL